MDLGIWASGPQSLDSGCILHRNHRNLCVGSGLKGQGQIYTTHTVQAPGYRSWREIHTHMCHRNRCCLRQWLSPIEKCPSESGPLRSVVISLRRFTPSSSLNEQINQRISFSKRREASTDPGEGTDFYRRGGLAISMSHCTSRIDTS